MKERSPITSHVLDTHRGKPAAGMSVHLEKEVSNTWKSVGKGTTNADGRVEGLLPVGTPVALGIYRLSFDTKKYFEKLGSAGFFPKVTVLFEVTDGEEHYHVPLLLTGHGYTTYRGS